MQFINNRTLKLFFYAFVYWLVFFAAKTICFDKGDDILQLSFFILPLFLLNGFLPEKYKPFVFPLLFLVISFYVFDAINAIILFTVLSLIALFLVSNMKWMLKLILSMLVFVLLFLLLSGRIQAGTITYIVPFLGSILMFRMVIILYDLKYDFSLKDKFGSWSYFFSFPQLFFPVMPILDHKQFLNGRNEKDEFHLYDKALVQFSTGVFLFAVYKIINQVFSPSVYEIVDFSGLMLYIVSKSVILFKLVGVFIFSIGFLSMFGVNLPSSFGFFPLASTFRDYWKDVNRFWRDFILKIIYYPLFFKLKKSRFPGKGFILILVTFMTSCFFHFYQLYWSTGYFKFKMTDVLYWFLLGLLVFYSGYRFEKLMKQMPRTENGFITLFKLSLSVLFVQVVMNVLFFVWTTESVGEVVFLMRQGFKFSFSVIELLLVYWLIFVVGIIIRKALTRSAEVQTKVIQVFKYSVPLIIIALYFLHVKSETSWSQKLFASDYLTVNQHESNEEGYYTRLMSSNSNSKMGKEGNLRVSPLTKISFTTNTVLRQELMPLQSIEFNGTIISTNSFGLRDKEYSLKKTVGVKRIAILGASYEMGTGVNNDQVFESIAEDWLNKYSGKNYELLNFGVPMYSVIQNAYVLNHKVTAFHPDMVFLFSHTGEEQRLVNNITRLIKEGFTFDDDFIKFIIEKAGIKKRMSALEIKYKLKPHIKEVFSHLYKNMVDVCKSNGIQPVWVFLPTTNESIIDYTRVNNLREVAKQAGFETYSLRRIYSGYPKDKITVSNIDPHPNALGHVLIAGGLYSIINEPKKAVIYE